MRRKHFVLLALTLTAFAAIFATQMGWSKAHVPTHKAQVCHVEEDADITSDRGVAITVSVNALTAHLNHGDCQLPSCDFNNVFHTGDACNRQPQDECPLSNPRDDAGGVTPGCPAGTF